MRAPWLFLLVIVAADAVAQPTTAAPRREAPRDTVKIHVLYGVTDFQVTIVGQWDGSTVETLAMSGDIALGITSATASSVPTVEYRIYSSTAGFDTGIKTLSNVPPNAWLRPVENWTLKSGTHTFTAILDPNRKLDESDAQRQNNTTTKTITLSLFDEREVRATDFQVPATALVSSQLSDPGGLCRTSGPALSNSYWRMGLLYSVPLADCILTAEIFKNARVGNGWTVSRVVLSPAPQAVSPISWEGTVSGSGTSLLTIAKLRPKCNPCNTNNFNDVSVRTYVRGPRSTQPTFSWAPVELRIR